MGYFLIILLTINQALVLIPQKNLRNNSFFFDASKPAMQRNIQSDLSQSATNFNNIPLLQITVQPLDPNDYGHLKEALELFSSCEESVKFWVDESTGDLVIGTDGEINLQKSINDLKEFYCQGIEFKESEIFVKMKETIKVSTEEKYFKFIEQSESIDLDSISVKVLPLSLHRVLVGEEKMEDIYTRIKQYNHDFDSNNYQAINCANSADSNILLINKNIPFTVTNALKAGFVTCCKQGWLAGEPLAGFGFVVDRFDASKCSSNSNLCILLLRMMKNAMQERFQINDFRIFWPIFKCYTTCALSQIRDIQNIIEQRYGMIVGENLDFEISGGKSVDIVTELPVFKSLGIFKEIQSQSSGAILPRLEFSHWEILDIDPNWKPSDFNDLELYGTSHANVGGDENISHEIVRSIKKRKGLKTENVLIKDSNKQRTLTKSK
ncbi:MAG: Cytoplasmic GTPase/eEF2-like protein (ribosomal biogenesis) [Marteilia pararefringens]